MKTDRYNLWMINAGLEDRTRSTSLSTLGRIEGSYGSLDDAFATDGLESIFSELVYSKSDERNNQPNPSRIEINGNIYNSLASFRTHLNYYRRFLETQDTISEAARLVENVSSAAVVASSIAFPERPEAVFSMERDLNAALRQSMSQLEEGLIVCDGGRERSVASGRIDIFAEDLNGLPVVVELKAVTAPRDAIAQVLSYMGDIEAETGKSVRGFLIAPDFDPRAVSAARMVPSLRLVKFRFDFIFNEVAKNTGEIP